MVQNILRQVMQFMGKKCYLLCDVVCVWISELVTPQQIGRSGNEGNGGKAKQLELRDPANAKAGKAVEL
jgi:hypothetical protein